MTDPLLFVVLAAGKGTRMRSARPKVLHEVAGRSMLGHVLALAGADAFCDRETSATVVVGPQMDSVRDEAVRQLPAAAIAVQQAQRGTGDAVKAARDAIAAHDGHTVVLFGDTPLIKAATVARMTRVLGAGADVVVLGFEADDPTGYGRLLSERRGEALATFQAPDGIEAHPLRAIREHKDCTSEELETRLCNAGVMAFRSARLPALLDALTDDNANAEFYLTDTVELALAAGLTAVALIDDERQVLGVNTRVQLAAAEAIFQHDVREHVMREGATLMAPETVYFSFDTAIGQDVMIEPNVVFGPGVRVDDGATIRGFSHLEGAHVGPGATIGPFARLRPGARLGDGVKVGNFVELKAANVGAGAKVPHLSYVGDADVGAGANIGAGTITCNYDGFFKHKTTIGSGAFIGSNSSLVAPVTVGDGAYIGSGSVISKDVAPGDLSLTRAPQSERAGWADKFRARMTRLKEAAKKD